MLLVQNTVPAKASDSTKGRAALDPQLLGLLEQPLEQRDVPVNAFLVHVEAQDRAVHVCSLSCGTIMRRLPGAKLNRCDDRWTVDAGCESPCASRRALTLPPRHTPHAPPESQGRSAPANRQRGRQRQSFPIDTPCGAAG